MVCKDSQLQHSNQHANSTKYLWRWHIIPKTFQSGHCHETPEEKKDILNIAEQLRQMSSHAETVLQLQSGTSR